MHSPRSDVAASCAAISFSAAAFSLNPTKSLNIRPNPSKPTQVGRGGQLRGNLLLSRRLELAALVRVGKVRCPALAVSLHTNVTNIGVDRSHAAARNLSNTAGLTMNWTNPSLIALCWSRTHLGGHIDQPLRLVLPIPQQLLVNCPDRLKSKQKSAHLGGQVDQPLRLVLPLLQPRQAGALGMEVLERQLACTYECNERRLQQRRPPRSSGVSSQGTGAVHRQHARLASEHVPQQNSHMGPKAHTRSTHRWGQSRQPGPSAAAAGGRRG